MDKCLSTSIYRTLESTLMYRREKPNKNLDDKTKESSQTAISVISINDNVILTLGLSRIELDVVEEALDSVGGGRLAGRAHAALPSVCHLPATTNTTLKLTFNPTNLNIQ